MVYIHKQISLIQKSYDLYKIIHQNTKNFPKSDKYCLGEKIKNINLEILELLIEAEVAKRDWKTPILEKTSHKVKLLEILIRLAYEIRILDDKKYLDLQDKLQEIGRMIGGWIKTVK